MQVVVLAGGLSPERDVSLRSGRRIAEALRTVDSTIEVTESDVDGALIERLRAQRPDCVVPLLHGAAGEDGALRHVLEALGLPFVGASAQSASLAFDKPVAKTILQRAGLVTPPAIALPHSTFRELGANEVLAAVLDQIGLPLVVKPTKGGSALGTAVVRDATQFPAAIVGALAYSEVALMEQFIGGTEVSVNVVERNGEPQALPSVEIVPDGDIYDYNSRYTAGTTEFFIPARLSDQVREECARVAVAAHRALRLRDWSRSDLIVDADGTPWLLEVNVAPGMTETSLFPQALAATGEGLGELTAELIRNSIARS